MGDPFRVPIEPLKESPINPSIRYTAVMSEGFQGGPMMPRDICLSFGKLYVSSSYTEKNRGINLIILGKSSACNETDSSRIINCHIRVISDSLFCNHWFSDTNLYISWHESLHTKHNISSLAETGEHTVAMPHPDRAEKCYFHSNCCVQFSISEKWTGNVYLLHHNKHRLYHKLHVYFSKNENCSKNSTFRYGWILGWVEKHFFWKSQNG